jgi:hypothetical protein
MPHHLSPLGIGHTLISLIPLAAGIYSFVRHRGIDGATRSGRIYLAGLALSVFTSFGLSSTGGLNAGHALGILALLAAGAGVLASRIPFPRRLHPHLSALAYSFSFFLLLVPGINETLTRLPAAHPLAEGPQSLVVRGALTAWLAFFVLGSVLQALWIRSRRKAARVVS